MPPPKHQGGGREAARTHNLRNCCISSCRRPLGASFRLLAITNIIGKLFVHLVAGVKDIFFILRCFPLLCCFRCFRNGYRRSWGFKQVLHCHSRYIYLFLIVYLFIYLFIFSYCATILYMHQTRGGAPPALRRGCVSAALFHLRCQQRWVRPYLAECTISRPICEVKRLQASLVRRSVMALEPGVPYPPSWLTFSFSGLCGRGTPPRPKVAQTRVAQTWCAQSGHASQNPISPLNSHCASNGKTFN